MTAQNSDWKNFVGNIEFKDLLLPTAVFIGAAVIGRVFGFKPFLRGATAALALATAAKDAGIIDGAMLAPAQHEPRRKTVARATAVKHTARKKSARKLARPKAAVTAA